MSESSVSTETPAETLRRAAEMMRAAANLATAGPYVVIPTGGHVEIFGHDHVWVADVGCDETTQAHHDARYMAAMHPGVALAVAAWLEAAADGMHIADDCASEVLSDGQVGIKGFEEIPDAADTAAYRVARAYLGEVSP